MQNSEITNSYCLHCLNNPDDTYNREYHDNQYGFPIEDDDELFGRLILEINQAGLSWLTILKKEKNFRKAYNQYSIKEIASYADEDFNRLMNDAGIIRNKLKINAAIFNANRILEIQKEHGSFKNWLDLHLGYEKKQWVKLFKKEFKFTGGEITNEFLMSTGYLPGAHDEHCPIFQKIIPLNPPYLKLKTK